MDRADLISGLGERVDDRPDSSTGEVEVAERGGTGDGAFRDAVALVTERPEDKAARNGAVGVTGRQNKDRIEGQHFVLDSLGGVVEPREDDIVEGTSGGHCERDGGREDGARRRGGTEADGGV